MIERTLFTAEHEAFRDVARRFVETEVAPFHYQWETDGGFPRELWTKAGGLGLLCPNVPEEYGGPGGDFLHNVIVVEEFWRVGASGPGSAFMVHSDVVSPYLMASGNEALKHEWLPKMVSGEKIGALGMTEPGAGSDLQSIRTRAARDGGCYRVSGQKIFISNGLSCDFIVLACKTDPNAGAKGISLLLIEKEREGFKKGRGLDKIGLLAQDLAELFFEDVEVPAANLVGEENGGFKILMGNLVQERLGQAVRSLAVCEAALDWTVSYTRERKAFGQTIADFQNTQFVLADLATKTTLARVFGDWCIEKHLRGSLDPINAAKLKMASTELQGELVDKCLQFFGGYGYMREYPIARAFVDARLTRIAGGAVEVMKQIIARDLMKGGA